MNPEVVETAQAPRAIGPYVQAVRVGDFLFLSGQVGIDPATAQIVEGGIREQTGQVLKNISAVLQAAHSSLGKVLKTTVYLTDLNEFQQMNEVYGRYFSDWKPARATVQVSRLPLGAKVEIEAVAVIEGGE
ncbi:MAG: RidA family protein [Acidobacteria bacterium]|nr:RidA family protein [Acidobacteriota bacterium]